MKIEGVSYHSTLTSDIESLAADLKSGFEKTIGELDSVRKDFDLILSSVSHARDLSASLDRVPDDPSQAIGSATDAFRHYSRLYDDVHSSVSGIKKGKSGVEGSSDFLDRIWGRYTDLLHKLVTNAVSSVKKYAQMLGIKEFSITVSSMPPSISATFYFQ